MAASNSSLRLRGTVVGDTLVAGTNTQVNKKALSESWQQHQVTQFCYQPLQLSQNHKVRRVYSTYCRATAAACHTLVFASGV